MSESINIKGEIFILTDHLFEKMKERKVSRKQIIKTIKNGELFEKLNSLFAIRGNIRVCLESSSEEMIVKTVYRTNHPNHSKAHCANLWKKL